MKVLLFGMIATESKRESIELDLPDGVTVDEVKRHLQQALPASGGLIRRSRVAVNLTYAGPSDVVKHGDETALIPPVSGG